MSFPPFFSATEKEFAAITEVWEASVRATHDFLDEEYLQFIKTNLPTYLRAVSLYAMRNSEGELIAFIGIYDRVIEMLFIHPSARGKGFGKKLIHFAYRYYKTDKVDVNEQNTQAVIFYEKMGFEVIGRDQLDNAGKPYPILHMQLKNEPRDFVRHG